MGEARLGSINFRIDPRSVKWGFSVKTSVTETVGGRVIQVFGTKVNQMTVTGYIGSGGYTEHRDLVRRLTELAEEQTKDGGTPLQFVYPSFDWEFTVYISAIEGGMGGPTLEITPGKIDYEFTLTLFLVQDNADLKKIATNDFIKRFAVGIGWTPNNFNGITDYTAYMDAMTAQNTQSAQTTTPPTRNPDTTAGASQGGR